MDLYWWGKNRYGFIFRWGQEERLVLKMLWYSTVHNLRGCINKLRQFFKRQKESKTVWFTTYLNTVVFTLERILDDVHLYIVQCTSQHC